MSDNILIFGAGVFLLVHFVALFKLGQNRGGMEWIISAGALYGSGLFGIVATEIPAVAFLPPVLSTLFAGMLYLGLTKFLGVKSPDWFLPVLLVVTCLRGVIQPLAPPMVSVIPGAIFIIAASIASSWLLITNRKTDLWSILFLSGAVGIAFSSLLFVRSSYMGLDYTLSLTVWMMTSIFLGGSQVLLLLNRISESVSEIASTLSSLIDSLPSGVLLTDNFGNVTAANAYLANLLQLEKTGSLIGRSVDSIPPALQQRVNSDLSEDQKNVLENLTENRIGDAVKFQLDDNHVIMISSSTVESDTGQNIGSLWFFNDVSEAWRLGREQDEVRRLEMLVSLAGGIAHEFNNRLTAVKGNINHAVKVSKEPSVHESLLDISAAADKCINLTTNLLTIASVLPRELKTIDLAQWLPRILEHLAQDLPKTVELSYVAQPDVGEFRADPNQLKKLLTILVENSCNAITEEGEIKVKASKVKTEAGNWIEITIKDDGVGISEDEISKIFDPFYTSQEFGDASGLGLPMAKGIMLAHEGDVSIKSQPGKGTLVTTCWPADR